MESSGVNAVDRAFSIIESFEAGERLIKQFVEQTLASAGAANSPD